MSWDPDQYDRFEGQRLQPAIDLLSAIPTLPASDVVDLGCGTGTAFPILRERFPGAHLIGVERDTAMLEASRKLADESDIAVELIGCNIETWQPERVVDVIFSNAVLHWLPDHRDLFARLMSFLKPGGCLAVQLPNMWQEPVHILMRDIASDARWHDRALPACRIKPVLTTQEYQDALGPYSDGLRIWEETYPHNLDGENAVFEWIKGSSLKPVLDTLNPDERVAFSDEYASALRDAYPVRENGATLYPMKRLFIVATTLAD